jgi:hypothetical protein
MRNTSTRRTALRAGPALVLPPTLLAQERNVAGLTTGGVKGA